MSELMRIDGQVHYEHVFRDDDLPSGIESNLLEELINNGRIFERAKLALENTENDVNLSDHGRRAAVTKILEDAIADLLGRPDRSEQIRRVAMADQSAPAGLDELYDARESDSNWDIFLLEQLANVDPLNRPALLNAAGVAGNLDLVLAVERHRRTGLPALLPKEALEEATSKYLASKYGVAIAARELGEAAIRHAQTQRKNVARALAGTQLAEIVDQLKADGRLPGEALTWL